MGKILKVPLTTPALFDPTNPTITNAGAETVVKFAKRVSGFSIQNKSASPVYFAMDATANVGGFVVPANNWLFLDRACTALHLWTANATNINGTADSNIVIEGVL